jgi:hypothetical protein
MATAINPKAKKASSFFVFRMWRFIASRKRVTRDSQHVVDGYVVDYSPPSEAAVNAIDPQMEAFIARGRVVSVK